MCLLSPKLLLSILASVGLCFKIRTGTMNSRPSLLMSFTCSSLGCSPVYCWTACDKRAR